VLVSVALFVVSAFFLSLQRQHLFKSDTQSLGPLPGLISVLFLNNGAAVSQYYLVWVAMDVFKLYSLTRLESERLYLSYKADPRNVDALFFLANVVPYDRASAKLVIKYLKRSLCIRDTWKGYMYIGFLYYFYLRNYGRAVKYFKLSASMSGSRPYVKSLAFMAYYRAGRLRLAKQYLLSVYSSTKNKRRKRILRRKIRWIDTLIALNRLVKLFREREGKYPCNLEELVEKGYLKKVPPDPFGRGYYIDSKTHLVKSRI